MACAYPCCACEDALDLDTPSSTRAWQAWLADTLQIVVRALQETRLLNLLILLPPLSPADGIEGAGYDVRLLVVRREDVA